MAFHFTSDSSAVEQGAFVDDVNLSFDPGQVTVQGTFSYFDRDNTTELPARYMTAYLYDSNPGGADELLATTTTLADGSFQFPAVTNWEANGTRRDLYVVWETAYNDGGNTYLNPTRRVTKFGNNAYQYFSFIWTDVANGTLNASSDLPVSYADHEAMWIFQDLRRGWDYMKGQTAADPGSATAKWETGQPALFPCNNGSCFYAGAGGPYIFIADGPNTLSSDTVIHELGHHYMYNATSWWLWNDPVCLTGHTMFGGTDRACAWSEGWADFFPLPVNRTLHANDTCYDFGVGPCTGTVDQDYYDLEAHSRNDNFLLFPWGDEVEGRVAGALYDLFDSTNDGYDQTGPGFPSIWNTVKIGPVNFPGFWSSWKSNGYEKHLSVQSVYQNTIDYDTAPAFVNLPTLTLLEGITHNHAVDLWSYASDPESASWQLTYAFVSSTDWRCGASVDSHYVNFALQPGWTGSCDVTVRASDNIHTGNGTFTANIVPVRARIYLPFIAK